MDIFQAILVLNAWNSAALSSELDRQRERLHQACIEATQVLEDRATYISLDMKQGQAVTQAALDLYDLEMRVSSSDLTALEILENLAIFHPQALSGFYQRFLDLGVIFWSGRLFRGADPTTRDHLLRLIREDLLGQPVDPYTPGMYGRIDVVGALAWIGDATVQRQFAEWINHPPTWTKNPVFHSGNVYYQSKTDPPTVIELDRIAWLAGWEPTPMGKRRDLVFPQAYNLVRRKASEEQVQTEILRVAVPSEEQCGWCGRVLVALFDLDTTDLRLAFFWPGEKRLRVGMCVNCSLQLPGGQKRLFVDVDGQGKMTWSQENGLKPEHVDVTTVDTYRTALEVDQFTLGDIRVTAYDTAGDHLGGHPHWIQNVDYPLCPTCQRTMRFLGQIEPDAPYLEGTIYAFLCRECGKSTIGYQQT